MENSRPEYIANSEFFYYYISSIHNSIFNSCTLNFLFYEKRFNTYKKEKNIILYNDVKIFEIFENLGYSILSYEDRTHAEISEGSIIYQHKDIPIYLLMKYDYADDIDTPNKNLVIRDFQIFFYPDYDDNDTNDKTIDNIINIINSILDTLKVKKQQKRSTFINIITKGSDGYNIIEKEIAKDLKFEEVDLHYGDGFNDKYEQLIENINNNKKGMILFHGLPGTGKTYCIQHLLTRIENKIPIYLSSDMVNSFTDPEFIDFLLYEANILNKLDENLFFIIEDSEQLVMQRDSNYINNGISNLLNTTDGILNGMLNIQALLTFNTDIKNVDNAILRNERLLGQFEFGPVKPDRIKKLAQYLKIENVPDDFYKGNNVIADIYALNKKRSTIKFMIDNDSENKNFIL